MSLTSRFESIATVEQTLSTVKTMHKVMYQRELMDGAPTLISQTVLKGLCDLYPARVRQRVAILPQKLYAIKQTIPWFASNLINFTALMDTCYCTVTRSIELVARTQRIGSNKRQKLPAATLTSYLTTQP
uniref:Uncharacterized protein n=1 Tax=Aureoumbra lagunensis TaxID=44058 RepID=A0A7S3JWW5_9STRA